MLKRHIDGDLALVDILTLTLVFIIFTIPVPWLRVVLGVPFVMFFPGYILVAALSPRRESLGAIQRIGLSLGLSLAVMVLIGLMLGYVPRGIGLYSILLSVALFILLISGLAYYARSRVQPTEKFSVDLSEPESWLEDCSLATPRSRYCPSLYHI